MGTSWHVLGAGTQLDTATGPGSSRACLWSTGEEAGMALGQNWEP